jgi:hypothetical protein
MRKRSARKGTGWWQRRRTAAYFRAEADPWYEGRPGAAEWVLCLALVAAIAVVPVLVVLA